MTKWHGGKGSKQRPTNIQKYSDNYDRIFGAKMKVTIYSVPNCGYCKMAKQLAESKQCDVEYLMMGEDFEPALVREKFPQARTFPQIIVDGEHVGGYTELKGVLDG